MAQHHDGVSGTAKQAVTFDYAQRISAGYDIAADYLTPAVASIVTQTGSGDIPLLTTCPLLNISLCPTSQSNDRLLVDAQHGIAVYIP